MSVDKPTLQPPSLNTYFLVSLTLAQISGSWILVKTNELAPILLSLLILLVHFLRDQIWGHQWFHIPNLYAPSKTAQSSLSIFGQELPDESEDINNRKNYSLLISSKNWVFSILSSLLIVGLYIKLRNSWTPLGLPLSSLFYALLTLTVLFSPFLEHLFLSLLGQIIIITLSLHSQSTTPYLGLILYIFLVFCGLFILIKNRNIHKQVTNQNAPHHYIISYEKWKTLLKATSFFIILLFTFHIILPKNLKKSPPTSNEKNPQWQKQMSHFMAKKMVQTGSKISSLTQKNPTRAQNPSHQDSNPNRVPPMSLPQNRDPENLVKEFNEHKNEIEQLLRKPQLTEQEILEWQQWLKDQNKSTSSQKNRPKMTAEELKTELKKWAQNPPSLSPPKSLTSLPQPPKQSHSMDPLTKKALSSSNSTFSDGGPDALNGDKGGAPQGTQTFNGSTDSSQDESNPQALTHHSSQKTPIPKEPNSHLIDEKIKSMQLKIERLFKMGHKLLIFLGLLFGLYFIYRFFSKTHQVIDEEVKLKKHLPAKILKKFQFHLKRIQNSQMKPQEEVIHTYKLFLNLMKEAGFEKQDYITPYEYQKSLGSEFQVLKGDIDQITELFSGTLYGDLTVDPLPLKNFRTSSQRVIQYFQHPFSP